MWVEGKKSIEGAAHSLELEHLPLIPAASVVPYEYTLLVDGTGFETSRFFGYNHARHRGGEARTHKWAKPVIACIEDSKVIPAMHFGDSDDGENGWLLRLVERTHPVFSIKRLCADWARVKTLHYAYRRVERR